MRNINNILNTAKVIVLATVLTVGFQYVWAQTAPNWQAPTSAPPQGNTYAPLNVGPTGQVKDGGLTLGFNLGPSAPALIIKNGTLCLKPAPGAPGPFPPEGDCRGYWPAASATGSGISCSGGNCTANFFPIFDTDTSTVRNSIVKQFNDATKGNLIGIGLGAANPTERLDLGGSIRIRPNSGEGRVLTSDANGVGTWQNIKRTGTVSHGETVPLPNGFSDRNRCVWQVSPREFGSMSSNQGIKWFNASSNAQGVVTCQYAYEDSGGVIGGSCYYMIICS